MMAWVNFLSFVERVLDTLGHSQYYISQCYKVQYKNIRFRGSCSVVFIKNKLGLSLGLGSAVRSVAKLGLRGLSGHLNINTS